MAEPQPVETIRLDQFLKLQGIAGTGGLAKVMIQSGQVEVNGQTETHRHRKLIPGDTVHVGDIELVVETN